jgi:hypothetical protein
MTEFELFQMALPEDFVKDVIIPTTNDNLGSLLMLGEFYKWLGCNFFMACFQGIQTGSVGGQKRPSLRIRVPPFGPTMQCPSPATLK